MARFAVLRIVPLALVMVFRICFRSRRILNRWISDLPELVAPAGSGMNNSGWLWL